MKIRCRPLSTHVAAGGRRRTSPFDATWPATLRLLSTEARRLEADEVVIELDVPESGIRLDGWPYANARASSPDVTVWLIGTVHGDLCYATGSFDSWQANVRAVALGLEALRKVTRYGISSSGQQYVGWKAIGPGYDASTVEDAALLLARWSGAKECVVPRWWKDEGARAVVFRRAKARAHPDAPDGSHDAFLEVERGCKVLEANG